ncbi:hypothetical protein RintRC_3499 [Richelia intracellularis]|nr:hypothetical protein RintRC_3499 [Richelia intracellularis]
MLLVIQNFCTDCYLYQSKNGTLMVTGLENRGLGLTVRKTGFISYTNKPSV